MPLHSENALVLLSGGLDSVAAMHWAIEFAHVRALSFSYGQSNRDAELGAAQLIAQRRNVPHDILHLGHAVRCLDTLRTPPPGLDPSGLPRANIFGRNAILLSVAAAFAARLHWTSFDLVLGATIDDRSFPDCRSAFLSAQEVAMQAALAGVATPRIVAPWLEFTKSGVVQWCQSRPAALADVRDSVSCYSGTRCTKCDPCRARALAFLWCELDDGDHLTRSHGGDPARERR